MDKYYGAIQDISISNVKCFISGTYNYSKIDLTKRLMFIQYNLPVYVNKHLSCLTYGRVPTKGRNYELGT